MTNENSEKALLTSRKWTQYRSLEVARAKGLWIAERLERAGALPCESELWGQEDPLPAISELDLGGLSAASPVAHRLFERHEAKAIWKLLGATGLPLWFVTVINPRYFLDPKQLPIMNVGAMEKSIKRGLARYQHEEHEQALYAVGRFDFDLGLDERGTLIIRPHVHLIVACSSKPGLKRALRQKYKRVAHPGFKSVKILKAKDIGVLRYTLKNKLQGLPNGVDRGPHASRRKNPPRQLEIRFWREMLTLEIRDLLIFYGVRRQGRHYRFI